MSCDGGTSLGPLKAIPYGNRGTNHTGLSAMLNPLHVIAVGTLLADIVARFGNVAARSFISKVVHELDPGDEATALDLMSGMTFSENGVWSSAGPLFIYSVVDDRWSSIPTTIEKRTVYPQPQFLTDEASIAAIESGLNLLDEIKNNSFDDAMTRAMTKEEVVDRDRDDLCKIGSVVPR